MTLNRGGVKVSSSACQFSIFGSKDGILHSCADCLRIASRELQTLFEGPLAS